MIFPIAFSVRGPQKLCHVFLHVLQEILSHELVSAGLYTSNTVYLKGIYYSHRNMGKGCLQIYLMAALLHCAACISWPKIGCQSKLNETGVRK
jgi:hypothetical protein